MQIFRRNAPTTNKHEKLGRWPLRVRLFHLVEDFEMTPREQPEIFVVHSGKAVMDTEAGSGKQAIASGTVIVSRPGNHEHLVNVHALEMTGLRFLPEWFADQSETILCSADSTALWARMFYFHLASKDNRPEVFHLDATEQAAVASDLTVIVDGLKVDPDGYPSALMRLTLLKVLMHLAGQHGRFWRGEQQLKWPEELPSLLELFERTAARGLRMNLTECAQTTGISSKRISSYFEDGIGMAPMEYLERRRTPTCRPPFAPPRS